MNHESNNFKVLEGYEPQNLWRNFAQLSEIPRDSTKEAQVISWIEQKAQSLNYMCKKDSAGNLLVQCRSGSAHSDKLCVLQAHVDMVCEKEANVSHDFEKDPLELKTDGTWVSASGTTLGADNGLGVAMMLNLMEQKPEYPIDLLFTVDEERGLTGALGLDPAMLEANYLLNLDGEEEGIAYIGCAGGKDTTLSLEVHRSKLETDNYQTVQLVLGGLQGGHSGADIHLQRANALKLLGRFLASVYETLPSKTSLYLESFKGGDKHNAIPREARANLAIHKDFLPVFQELIAEFRSEILQELQGSEADFFISFELIQEATLDGLEFEEAEKLFGLLRAMPHGVLEMSRSIPGLVSSSTNLARAVLEKNTFILHSSHRSDQESYLKYLTGQMRDFAKLSKADFKENHGYPPWAPQTDAPLVQTLAQRYFEFSSQKLKIEAIHAGLECGVLGKKHPGMQMISFGPLIQNVHTPKERVHIESVRRTWDFLLYFLGTWYE